ncbi:MAG: ABC transporter permease [Gemmatimonadetes bacterium]|nr:ABC transporter permease [Gemmatimonadota bacterium]
MFRNYLIIALRNLKRQKTFSAINILGLAIGLGTCFLIVLYIQDELSFDSWHAKGDRIYQVIRETRAGGQSDYLPLTSGALAGALERDFPEVEKAVRVMLLFPDVRLDKKKFEMGVCVADPEIFEIFDFPFVRGNLETAFPNPNAIAITESAAKRLFGDEDPIGKTITAESNHHGGERTITAVLKDVPHNSTLQFDYVSTGGFTSGGAKYLWENWQPTTGWRPVNTYFLLREGADPKALAAKLPEFMNRYMGAEIARTNAYHLQPLNRIYLYSRQDYNLDWYGDIDRVYQFGAIAVLVLAIGCINFTNLTTAQSARRAHEVGLRKVSGAYRSQLMGQFLGESVLTSLVSLVLALVAVKLVLPEFNAFFSKQIELNFSSDPLFIIALLGIAVFVGLLAGVYPAFFLSAYEPTETLKGAFRAGSRGQWIRRGLVVAQFAISITLIASTGVIYQQLDYIKNKNLGFNMEQMVLMPIFVLDQETKLDPGKKLAARYATVKEAFLAHPNALEATAYRWRVGWSGGIIRTIRAEGHEGTDWRMPLLEVDEDYLDVFQIGLVEGRKFDPMAFPTDTSKAFIINETAVAQLGWDDPIGKSFEWVDRGINRKGTVIGVVQDFHYSPLRDKIGPIALTLRHQQFYNLGTRVKAEGMEETLAFFEKTWKQFAPADQPFDYMMWDQQFEFMYYAEQRAQVLTLLSSGMAILLACMGLFGLAAFTVEQRVKEIGVRKVLGASVSNIVFLVCRTFAIMVLIANLFAWPVAYFAMRSWLDSFAYRTDLSWWIFVLSGAVALAIALFTVSFHALRAALSNPVEALRHE